MRKIEKGEMSMLNEEICKLRDKLNISQKTSKKSLLLHRFTIFPVNGKAGASTRPLHWIWERYMETILDSN